MFRRDDVWFEFSRLWIMRINNNNDSANTEHIVLNYDAYKFVTALFIFHQMFLGNIQGYPRWGSGEPDLVEDVLVWRGGLGLVDPWRSLPSQTILWFHNSMLSLLLRIFSVEIEQLSKFYGEELSSCRGSFVAFPWLC